MVVEEFHTNYFVVPKVMDNIAP